MQKQWSFLDVSGFHYHIGMYHGQESGHFLLYINNRVSIIDFNILMDKNYTLYIGNELFQLRIKRLGVQDYSYQMEPISARLQQKPWEKVRDQIVYWFLIFLGFTLFFTLAFLFLSKIF